MKVDLKISALLDRLYFVPRVHSEGGSLYRALKQANPEFKFYRAAEGVWVDGIDSSKLSFEIIDFDISWTEETKRFVSNRKRVLKSTPNLLDEIKLIKTGGKEQARKYLANINGLDVLDAHQWVNVACMTLPNSTGLCIFDEQGAGKTVTLIFAFDALVERDEIDFALIIAPKSMVPEWPVDFSKFMKERYKVNMLTGSQTEKRRQLSDKADVIVTNFETAVSLEQELRAVLRRHDSRSILVVDESFFVKNLDAKRTQAIRRLREYCSRAFVLCGTPAPNSPVDLIEQFNIVDFGVTFNGVNLPKDRKIAAETVRRVVEERGPYIRHLKVDVLPELLPKKFNRIITPLQPKQFELYNKTLENLVTDLNGVDDLTFERNRVSFLARRSALLQICSNPVSISKGYDETPAKLLALDKILNELIDVKQEKVIIWSFYTASIENIFSRYQRYNPVRYDGTVNETSARREAVKLFRENSNTKLFVGNPAAAGAGLNLQSARYAVYESMSNQAAHYLQSLDRIHRRGQKSEVEYLILLGEGTVEIPEFERLIEKELAAQVMLGDKVEPPFTRQTLLSQLEYGKT